nr:MAG TPA: hypothetical protein [Caudoviricetes sp.]
MSIRHVKVASKSQATSRTSHKPCRRCKLGW